MVKKYCEGEGNGPVNALDNAIRKNVNKLDKYSKYLKDLRLVDYKVRILNTGTEAVTRVSIAVSYTHLTLPTKRIV